MRRIVPVIALFVIAPWAAECSWGGFPAEQIPVVVLFLGPQYGGAAILIRETARRTGGGWPAIILLAAAFGMLQAGLVDQSLFNPDYLDDTEFAGAAPEVRQSMVPLLDFSAANLLAYIGNHIALSICAPIAIVESFVAPERRLQPWLRAPGLAVTCVVYTLGSLMIFNDVSGGKSFVAAPTQLAFAVVTVLALIGAAFLPRWRRRFHPLDQPTPHALRARRWSAPQDPPTPRALRWSAPQDPRTPRALRARRWSAPLDRRAPRALWVGLLVATSQLTSDLAPGWPGVAVRTAAIVVTAVVVARWSRRTGWGQRHVLAAWSAWLLVAAAFAYLVPNYAPTSAASAVIGDIVTSLIALALVAGAFIRLRRAPSDPDRGLLAPP